MLNRDQVHPVVDLGNGMYGRLINLGESLNNYVAGVASFSQTLLGNNAFGVPIISNARRESRLLAWDMILKFDAAGSLAFNGKLITLRLRYLRNPVTLQQTIVMNMDPFVQVATARTTYHFALMGFRIDTGQFGITNWDGYCPAELETAMIITVNDGTFFPANTTVSNRLTVLQQPQNMRLHK